MLSGIWRDLSLKMNRVVFYSWQPDLPNSTNRGFIQAALESAAKAIANNGSNNDVPVIDRDTKDVAGRTALARTIFEKVEAADVLVADVSITQGKGGLRPTPNLNVLIELGYARCSLGDARIVLLMNDAYGARRSAAPFSRLEYDSHGKKFGNLLFDPTPQGH